MLSANEAGAPSRALLSEIFAQYTPTSLVVVYWGVKPGAAAASTPAEQNWPTGVPMPSGNSASAGIDGTRHADEREGHHTGLRHRERVERLPGWLQCADERLGDWGASPGRPCRRLGFARHGPGHEGDDQSASN